MSATTIREAIASARTIAGQYDHDPGDEPVQVGQDVLERALHVQAATVGPGQDPDCGQVHHHADQGHHDDRAAVNWRRLDKSPDRLEPKQGADHDQRDPVDRRRQDFRSFSA